MTKLNTVNLDVAPGVMSDFTDRGAEGRYKSSDKIRFRQLLPEKLGGWVLSTLGTDTGNMDPAVSVATETNTVYSSGVSSIPDLAVSIDVSDQDKVWLFGDSASGGLGGRTVSDATAITGATVFDLNASFTAAQGDALLIDYGEEFSGGATITGGGTCGCKMITVGTAITTFLAAGSRVKIETNSGSQYTTTATDLVSGATLVTLTDELVDDVSASTPNFFLYAPESIIVSNTQGIVVRFLGQAVSAATLLQITKPLPADADGLDVDVRPFQEVLANGDQTGTTITFSPSAANTITSVATFPDGLVIAPATMSTSESAYLGTARAVHDWISLDEQIWSSVGTDKKLYLINNNELYDITPIRESGTLAADPFDTSTAGAYDPNGAGDRSYVQVTDVAHGGQVGNYVRFSGATDVGGIPMNGEFVIATVTDPDTYVVQATVGALTTANGGGASVAYEYDIDVGASDNVTVTGYGAGTYGSGGYGVGTSSGDLIEAVRVWSLDNFGEDLLAAPNGGALYYWDRTLGPSSRAVVVTQAPATMQRMLVSTTARHVIAFGAGTGSYASPGVEDKLLIRWCSSENFTDWVSTSSNSAGELRLDVGSQIFTATESRGDIIVFTDESIHAHQYIGGSLVFSLRHLGQSVAIISQNGAVDVNGIVYFMSEDDFLIYDGVIRVMNCDIRNYVFDDINRSQGSKVFAAVNKVFTEVWWFYPSSSSDINDRYAKYNYKDQIWDYGTIERSAFHDSSSFLGKPYGFSDGKMYQHETGVDAANSEGVLEPMTSFLETWDMEITEGKSVIHISECIPDFKILEGSIDFRLSGRGYPARTRIYSETFTVTSETERVDSRFRTRQISFKVTSDALGDDWRMGTWRAGIISHGRRGG